MINDPVDCEQIRGKEAEYLLPDLTRQLEHRAVYCHIFPATGGHYDADSADSLLIKGKTFNTFQIRHEISAVPLTCLFPWQRFLENLYTSFSLIREYD